MKKFTWIAALIAALVFIFVGCDNSSGDGDITWTLEQKDGNAGMATTTRIIVKFSGTVTGFTTVKVNISGDADKAGAPVKGMGNNWEIPIKVNVEGTATVEIKDLAGVKDGSDTVSVYKKPITPPSGYDAVPLGGFIDAAMSHGNTQKAWVSNGYNNFESGVEIEDFIQAEYLWIWIENSPAGAFQITWQGVGAGVSGSEWFETEALNNSGSPSDSLPEGAISVTPEPGGTAFKFKLADVLSKTDTNNSETTANFTDAKAGFKLIIGYYSGTPQGVPSLGEFVAYLLLPEGTVAARNYVTVTIDPGNGGETETVRVLKNYPLGAKFPADLTSSDPDDVFNGWKAGDVVYDSNTPITDNITLLASWTD